MKSTSSKFSTFGNRNILIFYIITGLSQAWFMEGNWIFFMTSFLTFGQFGILESVAYTFGLLMEIPTGAVGDLLGKKKTLLLGHFLSFSGLFIVSLAHDYKPLVVAYLITQLGWAFNSGTAESLAYDSLKETNREEYYEKISSNAASSQIVVYVLAVLIGAILFRINFRLPYFVFGVTYFVSFILCFFLKEPAVDTQKFSLNQYRKQLSVGMKELLSPKLRKYFLIFFTLLGFYYIFDMGYLKPTMAFNFGFRDREQALIFALGGLGIGISVQLLPLIRKKASDFIGLNIAGIFLSLCFFIGSFKIGLVGILILLSIDFIGWVTSPWISIIVNKEIPSKNRATTLSTVALLAKIPYSIAALFIGSFFDKGRFQEFLIGLGLLIFIILFLNLIFTQKEKLVSTIFFNKR
jgi:predicted MFS family arabinose efflux permease